MNSNMVKAEQFDHLDLVDHFTVSLRILIMSPLFKDPVVIMKDIMSWLFKDPINSSLTLPNQTVKNGLKGKKIKLPQMNF